MYIKNLLEKVKNKDKDAMYELGILSLKGEKGVKKNFDEAYRLLEESAKLKNMNALFELSLIHLTDKYNVKNTNKSVKYLELSSKSGHKKAAYELGLIYFHGNIVKKNIEKAEEYFRKAAISEDSPIVEAQHIMGYIYENGILLNHRDVEEAFRFYEKAAKNGHIESQYKVGKYLIDGIEGYLEINIEEGIKYLQKAAENKDVKASNLLAKIYIEEAKLLLTYSSSEDKDAEYVLEPLLKIKTDIL